MVINNDETRIVLTNSLYSTSYREKIGVMRVSLKNEDDVSKFCKLLSKLDKDEPNELIEVTNSSMKITQYDLPEIFSKCKFLTLVWTTYSLTILVDKLGLRFRCCNSYIHALETAGLITIV